MAWYPGAVKMELQPESDAQAAIRPTQFIIHSIVAPWTARRTYEYWRDSTNLESHFGIDYEGTVGQYIGTETRADANAGANRRPDGTGAVSAETASNTSASDPWNAKQIEDLIAIGVWLHERHGIPLRICRTHSDPGYGYHSMFREWSTSGTACPGAARIRQFREVVFPGIVARAKGENAADTSKEIDMPLSDDDARKFWEVDGAVPAARPPVHNDDYYKADGKTLNNTSWAAKYALQTAVEGIRKTQRTLGGVAADVDKLTAAVDNLTTLVNRLLAANTKD